MTNNQLLKKIQKLPQMTPSEVKIADYFARHYSELAFENVTTISKKTGVSKATVVRFMSRLGYKKFNQFKEALRTDLTTTQVPFRYSLKKKVLDSGEEDILANHFIHITNNMNKTESEIDRKLFMDTARMIADPAGSLYITGQRSSYAQALYFHGMIQRIRPRSILVGESASTLADNIMDAGPVDVLFAIFRRPFSNDTLQLVKHFKEVGARIILLTDSEFNPLKGIANIQLVLHFDGQSIFESSASVVALLESLNIAVLKYCDQSVHKRLDLSEELYSQFDVFCTTKNLSEDS